MTLKDQTNHYNIKLLKGYGLSINVKDENHITDRSVHKTNTGVSAT
jgi:hypothetical protein